jgi:heme exporter protein B
MKSLKHVFALVEKDILAEIRTKEVFIAMFTFVLLVIIFFTYAFRQEIGQTLVAGILWMTFLFASVLGLNRTFVHEKDEGCLAGLMAAPIDRSAIYFGKVIGNFVFITLVELLTLPMFAAFSTEVDLFSRFGWLLLLLLLGNLGIATIGTIASAISINTKARELLLPLLVFPLILPVLIGAVEGTTVVISASPLKEMWNWLQLLVLYDIIFLLACFVLFEFAIEE